MSVYPTTPADRELLALDEAGRRAAQTEFERPLLLEAGAGTGKTTTLIHRILAWSLGHGWLAAAAELAREGDDEEPAADRVAGRVLEGIVAVTFTEAAAAEMAARVAEGLAGLASGAAAELTGFLAGELPPLAAPPPGASGGGALGGHRPPHGEHHSRLVPRPAGQPRRRRRPASRLRSRPLRRAHGGGGARGHRGGHPPGLRRQ